MKLYHGTTRNRVARILKEGLKPRAERSSTCFDDGKKVKVVCFTESFMIAMGYACRKSHMFSGIPVVLEIEYPKDKLLMGEENSTGELNWVSKKRIPGKYIVGFSTTRLISIKTTAKVLGLEINYD